MFLAWLQHAQPDQARHQQKRISPTNVSHTRSLGRWRHAQASGGISVADLRLRREFRSTGLSGGPPGGPAMGDQHEDWQRKGATLSDKTARAEFGLTQDEIIEAIHAGTLQYRQGSIYGNPWLRLLRREVEGLVQARHGDRYLRERQARAELARVNRELKRVRTQLAALEERRSELISDLDR
jgi:hypothetical protein